MSAAAYVEFYKKNKFSIRPKADVGLWILFLLPASLIITSFKHPIILTPTYKTISVISFNLLCNSWYIVAKCRQGEQIKFGNLWSLIGTCVGGWILSYWLNKGLLVSLLISTFSTGVFNVTFPLLLRELKESFTVGEAILVAQGVSYFLVGAYQNLFETNIITNGQISTTIIQIGLLGLAILAYVPFRFNIRSPTLLYLLAIIVVSNAIFLPLHILLKRSPILWIVNQIVNDSSLLKLFLYWTICIALAVLFIIRQISSSNKASTGGRKIFHLLAVLVFVPGLYIRCNFLYLSSGVILGLFFAIEILRVLKVPPLGVYLQDGYDVFRDEKDTGPIALTPIYLLVGVSMPIWIHPAPCDITDSAQFNILPLLSGLMSIGIGDTSASFIGSNFGRIKWKGSSKTIEGTVACILSQFIFVYFLFYFDLLPNLTQEVLLRIIFAIFTVSFVESVTTQIDNLVLPLVMYTILI